MTESQQHTFHCPGDPQPVSRSIHLARIAAGYDACRDCRSRSETGTLPRRVAQTLAAPLRRGPEQLISANGIRGISLNELTRERMAAIVEHVLELATREHQNSTSLSGRLRVLVGHDHRPSSPDLAIGVVNVLRRWGCDVADLSQLSRPAFDFAVDRLGPDLGLFVTGGLAPLTWNGLDVVDDQRLPWCAPGRLDQLASRMTGRASRICRQQGSYHRVEAVSEFAAALQRQFHALRPLRLVIGCDDPLTRGLLARLLDATPCVAHFLALVPSRNAGDEGHQLAEAMRERHADAGFVLAADGRGCTSYDERGLRLEVADMLAVLHKADDHPVEAGWTRALFPATATEAELLSAQQAQDLPIVADRQGRYWFRDERPRCAAILTLAKALQTFSFSDEPVSAWNRQSR